MKPTYNSTQSVLDSTSTHTSHSMQSSNHSNFFNIHISPFLGDPDLLEFFISQVKDVSASNRWSDKQALIFAKSKLVPARTFSVQKLEYHTINTTTELFNVFRTQFKKKNVCKAISAFNAMTVLPAESISNLAHRLDLLAPKAHNTIKDANALNAIKFNIHFLIPSNYCVRILQNNIQTYGDAIETTRLLQDCEVNNELICQTSLSTPLQNLRSQINELRVYRPF